MHWLRLLNSHTIEKRELYNLENFKICTTKLIKKENDLQITIKLHDEVKKHNLSIQIQVMKEK